MSRHMYNLLGFYAKKKREFKWEHMGALKGTTFQDWAFHLARGSSETMFPINSGFLTTFWVVKFAENLSIEWLYS